MAQHGTQLITTDFKLYHSVWRHSVLIQAYLFKNAARFTQIHAQCSRRKTKHNMLIFDLYVQQAELQEDMEARGERMGGVQTHKRMVASLEKQIAVQEKKLEQVSCLARLNEITIVNYILHLN